MSQCDGLDKLKGQHLIFEDQLSNSIKKFNSERNLFFGSVYGTLHEQHKLNETKKCEKSKVSLIKNVILRRCKSSKDVSRQTGSVIPKRKPINADEIWSSKRIEPSPLPHYSYRKTLDEFEQDYLMSNNRRNLVKELRKTFESQSNNNEDEQQHQHQQQQQHQQKSSPQQQSQQLKHQQSNKYGQQQQQQQYVKTTSLSSPGAVKEITMHIPTAPKKRYSTPRIEKCGRAAPPQRLINETENAILRKPLVSRHSFNCNHNRIDMTIESHTEYQNGINQQQEQQNQPVKQDQQQPQELNETKRQYHHHHHHQQMELNPLMRHSINNNNKNINRYVIDRTTSVLNQNGQIPVNLARSLSMKTNGYYDYKAQLIGTYNMLELDKGYNIRLSNGINCLPQVIEHCESKNNLNKTIDLNMLRTELDDYVDFNWCPSLLRRGYRSYCNLNRYTKKLDLEQKIELEIKMRDGSAKLLAAYKHPRGSMRSYNNNSLSGNSIQMLEAAKNFLTSNERIKAYKDELQREKQQNGMSTVGSGGVNTTQVKCHRKPTGRISLSEIRIPLMWRDSDHFKNKGNHRRYAVFVLAKIGTEIMNTSLLYPVDRNLTDISFQDIILFASVPSDFNLKFELYAVMMESDLSIASTPRKIKNTIHSSISKTMGKRLASNLKEELNNENLGPNFELVATANLTVSDVSDLPHTHDLCLSQNNRNGTLTSNTTLPLFEHFCCRLTIQPDCVVQPMKTSDVTLITNGSIEQTNGYARLLNFQLEFFDNEKVCQNNLAPSICTIKVTRDSSIKQIGDTDVEIKTMENGEKKSYMVRLKSTTLRDEWYQKLRQSVKDHQEWGDVVLSTSMELASPDNSKQQYFLRSMKQISLYDQVPVYDSIQEKSMHKKRSTLQDIFIPPETTTSATD